MCYVISENAFINHKIYKNMKQKNKYILYFCQIKNMIKIVFNSKSTNISLKLYIKSMTKYLYVLNLFFEFRLKLKLIFLIFIYIIYTTYTYIILYVITNYKYYV